MLHDPWCCHPTRFRARRASVTNMINAPRNLKSCKLISPIARMHARGAFTLVELVVVILVLGVLAAVALPNVMLNTRDAQVSAIMKHVRIGHDAAERYFADHGDYPRDSTPGKFPSDFDGYLRRAYFSVPAPGGGSWDWNGEAAWGGVFAGMSIRDTAPSTDLWQEVDNRYDDGNLATGTIKVFGSRTLQFELVP